MNSANQLMKAFGLEKPKFEFKTKWSFQDAPTQDWVSTSVNLDAGSPTEEQDQVIRNILRNHIFAHTGYGRIWADDLPGLQVALDEHIDERIAEGLLPGRVRGRAVVSYDLSTGMANVFYPVNDEMLRARRALRRVSRIRFA